MTHLAIAPIGLVGGTLVKRFFAASPAARWRLEREGITGITKSKNGSCVGCGLQVKL
jgi:hypothetical protein